MPLLSKNITLEKNGITAHRKKKEYARTEIRNRKYEKTGSVGVEDVKQETGRAKSGRRRQAVERQEEMDRLGSTQTV
jgi:hypothetical protein